MRPQVLLVSVVYPRRGVCSRATKRTRAGDLHPVHRLDRRRNVEPAARPAWPISEASHSRWMLPHPIPCQRRARSRLCSKDLRDHTATQKPDDAVRLPRLSGSCRRADSSEESIRKPNPMLQKSDRGGSRQRRPALCHGLCSPATRRLGRSLRFLRECATI